MSATERKSTRKRKQSIVIVDDHPILRRGLAALIHAEPDLEVIDEAGDFDAAMKAIRRNKPDLVLVDLMLEGRNGLDVIKEMHTRHPDIPAIVFSMHDETLYGERAMRAGARGYVTKQQLDELILVAIREVLSGGTFMSDTLQGYLASKYMNGGSPTSNSPVQLLSDRELQVFEFIGRGKSTRQIAADLVLSIKTIESHLANIKRKLAVDCAAGLMQRAVRFVESSNARQ